MGKIYSRSMLVAEIHDVVDTTEGNRVWLDKNCYISDEEEWQVFIGIPDYPDEYKLRAEQLLASAREANCSVSLLNIIVIATEQRHSCMRFLNI